MSNSMQVWFVSTQQAWGGGEVYLAHLAAGLRDLGQTIRFAAPAGSQLADRMQHAGFEVFEFAGRGRDPRTIWRLRQKLRRGDRSIVHCNDSHALVLGGLASAGLTSAKTIAMRHTMFRVRSPSKYHRLADRVVCVSQAVAESCISDGLNRDCLDVVHVGIPIPKVDPVVVAERRKSVCREGERLVVAVGNLLECKGHAALLEAVDGLQSDSRPLVLAIAGEGRQRGLLEQQIAGLRRPDAIRLLGFQTEPHDWIAAADLVVHPSYQEGLCLTVVAAMMLRRPVVASAVGGLCEVIAAHQENEAWESSLATVCRPGSADHIASAMKTVLAPEQVGSDNLDRAYQHAMKLFSARQMVHRTRAVYQSLWRDSVGEAA